MWTFYCFRVTLMQWGNRLWSALYSRASFNQNTDPVVLIKHRTAKVFTDVFYNVDFEPLKRAQWNWPICLILFLWRKKKKTEKKGQETLWGLNSQSCQVVLNLIPQVYIVACLILYLSDLKVRKIHFKISELHQVKTILK